MATQKKATNNNKTLKKVKTKPKITEIFAIYVTMG